MFGGMERTILALVQRGLSSSAAEKLVSLGHTLNSLATLSAKQVASLQIPMSAKSPLLQLTRPPIPAATVRELLYESAYTCCLCRQRGNGFILHHIEPWEKSKNHAKDNLAVLCPGCHDEAHTHRQLSRSITSADILSSKQRWSDCVKQVSTEAIFAATPWSILGPVWDYFNHPRLLRLARELNVNLNSLKGYSQKDPANEANSRSYRYAGRMRVRDMEYEFYKGLLRHVCEIRSIINLAEIWSPSQLRAVLRPNALVAYTGHFRFRPVERKVDRGPGQTRLGYVRRHGIRLEFSFDAWECTTNSSWSHHLRGGCVCTSICILRAVEEGGNEMKLNVTCLAIGTGFGGPRDSIKPAIAWQKEMEGERWDVSDE
jgi:hypothetical protein